MITKDIITRIELLEKPVWTYADILEFDTNITSPSTAIKIKKRAIREQNGTVPFGSQYVKADSVLALYGTNREQEIKVLRGLLNEEMEEINI